MKLTVALAGLAFLFLSTTAGADSSMRCDCNRVVGSCGGRVTLDGTTLVIQSSKPQCSRVTWYADDVPQSTIVVGGRAVQTWQGKSADPVLSVANCDLCIDMGSEITCVFPDASLLVIPDGTAATYEEMSTASADVKNFQARANGYLECLNRKFSVQTTPEAGIEHDRRHNLAVDQMEAVADRFNVELKAYRESSR